jgi:hypothetical protein
MNVYECLLERNIAGGKLISSKLIPGENQEAAKQSAEIMNPEWNVISVEKIISFLGDVVENTIEPAYIGFD